MAAKGMSMDKAELLSVLLEAILYGFSVLMFGMTIWVLWFRRTGHQVNYKMLTTACALLVLSTTHIILHIIRIMDGLILDRMSFPGGPDAFFADVSQWTFVWKNHVYTAQSLVGDGVVIYRCYSVWQSKLILIFPLLCWFATGITGFASSYIASKLSQNEVFGGSLAQWITSFWVMALLTNLLSTNILAWRIWYVDRQTKKLRVNRKSQLRPILNVIVDAGVIYTLMLLAALACFVTEDNGQYVTLDMVTPIISITFYMVIIRVGLANPENQTSKIAFDYTSSTRQSVSADRRNRMEVHVMTLTESKIENGLRPELPMNMAIPIGRETRRSQIKLDSVKLDSVKLEA